jgi:hypothetical protein
MAEVSIKEARENFKARRFILLAPAVFEAGRLL